MRPGLAVLSVEGKGAFLAFRNEPGGHRWQGESKGKVHTSTVTVVVLREPSETEVKVNDRDLEWSTCRSSGAGGQKVNKTESAVIVKHVPTGLTVRCESERSQHQNRATALALLRARLFTQASETAGAARQADRRQQHGVGARGDKRRTLQEQNNVVVDHVTGKRMPLKDYLRGMVDGLA